MARKLCSWASATWDTELIYEVGAAFGQESLQSGINGWFCPAINLHRSAFNGRVFEYYSEDPVLSGKLAAAVHNICYTVANSNTMQGMVPGAVMKTAMSPWMKTLIVVDVAVGLLSVGGVAWIVLHTRQEKAHPELFRHKAPKKAKKA